MVKPNAIISPVRFCIVVIMTIIPVKGATVWSATKLYYGRWQWILCHPTLVVSWLSEPAFRHGGSGQALAQTISSRAFCPKAEFGKVFIVASSQVLARRLCAFTSNRLTIACFSRLHSFPFFVLEEAESALGSHKLAATCAGNITALSR